MYMLTVEVATPPPAISYILAVLLMMSCFDIMVKIARIK